MHPGLCAVPSCFTHSIQSSCGLDGREGALIGSPALALPWTYFVASCFSSLGLTVLIRRMGIIMPAQPPWPYSQYLHLTLGEGSAFTWSKGFAKGFFLFQSRTHIEETQLGLIYRTQLARKDGPKHSTTHIKHGVFVFN